MTLLPVSTRCYFFLSEDRAGKVPDVEDAYRALSMWLVDSFGVSTAIWFTWVFDNQR